MVDFLVGLMVMLIAILPIYLSIFLFPAHKKGGGTHYAVIHGVQGFCLLALAPLLHVSLITDNKLLFIVGSMFGFVIHMLTFYYSLAEVFVRDGTI